MDQPLSRLIRDSNTNEPIIGVGAGTVEKFLSFYYPLAKEQIRIASAYFRLAGYSLVRKYISNIDKVQIQILVGPREGHYSQLAVRDEIERELSNGRGLYYPIVKDLVRRIEEGKFIIRDAREMQFKYHCKFYICDQKVLVHGSGNYTIYGLRSQHEQASATKEQNAIIDFTNWFDEASGTAKNMTQPILEVLQNWLKLSPPFHAYLKFLESTDIFFDRENKPGLFLPNYYQQWLIEQSVEHIKEYRASIIIAATGLGKTIVGAELSFQLHRLEIVNNIILIAPVAVHSEWKEHLKVRGFSIEPFSNGILFKRKSEKSYHEVYRLDKALSEADDKTLIVIDEAHIYRNQTLAHWKKHIKGRKNAPGSVAVDRIRAASEKRKVNVVLLTATPYGTNQKNLESLLRFVPDPLDDKDMTKWAGWKAATLEDFIGHPFVSAIGLRQVLKMARDRGDIMHNRVFVQFGDALRYLPKTVHLNRVEYKLPASEELRDAYDTGYFTQESNQFTDRFIKEKQDYGTTIVDIVENHFITAWMSSPAALINCLERNLSTEDGKTSKSQIKIDLEPDSSTDHKSDIEFQDRQTQKGYRATMSKSHVERAKKLTPILDKVTKIGHDEKTVKLLQVLTNHVIEKGEKVIIFVKYYATAIYIEEYIQKYGGAGLSIGCTVVRQGKQGYNLMGEGPRNWLIDKFSPNSRRYITENPLNVLICTDANGIGVNLQDADVVINYDPADSIDILFQRAGRIIRFTDNPQRIIKLYTFKPDINMNIGSKAYNSIENIFDTISDNHKKSSKTFGMSILPKEENEELDLDNPITEANFASGFDAAKSIKLDNPYTYHASVYDKNKILLASIGDRFFSSMVYKSPQSRIAILLLYSGKKHMILYNLGTKKFEHLNSKTSILNFLSCEKDTENAPVDLQTVEASTLIAVKKWRKMNNINPETDISTICGIYLAPKIRRSFARQLLAKFSHLKKKRTKG